VKEEYSNLDKSKLKYMHLADRIVGQIKSGALNINDQIPSVNQLSVDFNMSKSTVLMGLNHLSEKGIIESVYRKGYFVRKSQIDHDYRIFFLMDTLTVFKEELYQAFYNQLKDRADIDVFFHNYNYWMFERLIKENLHYYTHFVIISILEEDVSSIINQIPPEKRIILDYNEEGLTGNYSAVYQDFEGDLYSALRDVKERIEKYKRLVLVLPDRVFYGHLVKAGFQKFCEEFNQPNTIINKIRDEDFAAGDVYITLNRYDIDDVNIIKLIHKRKLKLGKDVGLISYNDLYMKEVLEGGLTVISTDFRRMGEEGARLILEGRIAKIRNPSKLIIRNSL
jgi:DNA-binding transcriptional regulator YhcF (GntR family)